MKTNTPIFTASELQTIYSNWQEMDSTLSRSVLVDEATAIALKEARRLSADEDKTQAAVEAAIRAVTDSPERTDDLPTAARLAARYAVLNYGYGLTEHCNSCVNYEEHSSDDPERDAFYAQLRGYISGLPKEDAFILNSYYGFNERQLSLQQIADALSVARSTVHRRLNELLKQLGRKLNA